MRFYLPIFLPEVFRKSMKRSIAVMLIVSASKHFGVAKVHAWISPDSLANRTEAERMRMLSDHYIFGSRMFSFAYVDSMRSVAEKYHDEGLMWESRLFEGVAYFYCFERKAECSKEKVIDYAEGLLQDARKHNQRFMEVRVHGLLGALYFNNVKNYELGIEHFVRAVELLDGVSEEEFPHKTVVIYKLGIMYYKFQDYANAKKYLFEVLNLKGAGDRNDYIHFHALNTLGLCYQQLGLLDSSDICFNINLERSKELQDEPRIGLTMGNMGANEFMRKRYDRAIPLLKEDLRIGLKRNDLGTASNAASLLGEIALKQGRIDDAKKYLYQALDLAHRKKYDFGRFEAIFSLLSKLEAKLGHPDLSAIYLDSAILLRDSAATAFNALKMKRVEQRLELEKVNRTLVEATGQRNMLIFCLSLGGIIAALLFGIFQLRSHNQQQLLMAMKEKAEYELQEAEQRLNEFMETFRLKNKMLEQTRSELENLRTNTVSEPDRTKLLGRLQESVILTEKDWREFQDLFEQVHVGFFARLKERVPDPTQSEVRFLALKRLRLSNKEMASMLGVSVSTIRSLQSRLMPKISLQNEQTLEDFIAAV